MKRKLLNSILYKLHNYFGGIYPNYFNYSRVAWFNITNITNSRNVYYYWRFKQGTSQKKMIIKIMYYKIIIITT